MDQVTNSGNSAKNAHISLTDTDSVVSSCITNAATCTIVSAVKFVLRLQNPLMRAVIAHLRNFLLTEIWLFNELVHTEKCVVGLAD